MSYIRWGEEGSAVYVVGTPWGLTCMSCYLTPDSAVFPESEPWRMIAHLEAHRIAGHQVPEVAFTRLRHDFPDA